MGVRGLQYYLEVCCQSASPTVNIQELASRRRRDNERLIIVLDGSSCTRILYDDLEWIGGAQLNQYAEKVQDFVEAFREIGIHLVVFFDGPTVEQKRSTWIERRLNTLNKIYYVLDKISNGTPSNRINRKQYFHLPPGMGQLSRVLFEEQGCEVYQSVTECDEEIAEYARRNGVFAVLSQDSDYVILDTGDAHYLSMDHLNIDDMTTRLYDRRELANHLRIRPDQLPLLATLMGNDIIPYADLENFHRRILHQRFPNRKIDFSKSVPNIAMYIRRLPVELNHDETSLYSEVSKSVFGHPDRKDDIQRSVKSYTTQSTIGIERGMRTRWTQLVTLARQRHQRNELPSMVYAIMNGLPFESSTSVEDFRLKDLPYFASVTQPIRERVYGILLLEKPTPRSGHHLVPEWCMAGPNSLDQVKYVQALPPPGGHPGLEELWREGQNTLKLRWRLFVKSVSPNLDVERVRDLPGHLLVPTLIMFYLRERRCLNEFEIDAVLSTAASLKHYDGWSLSELPADPMTSRSIRVANLYMRITFVIYFLQAACGYPRTVQQTAPWQFFDGKLFQMKYRFAEEGMTHFQLCENKSQVLEEFLAARRIVFHQN